MFADMSALLLGWPRSCWFVDGCDWASAGSRFLRSTKQDRIPRPYLRLLISAEMLRRMGFSKLKQNNMLARGPESIPTRKLARSQKIVVATFPKACAVAVDAMCYQPYPISRQQEFVGTDSV